MNGLKLFLRGNRDEKPSNSNITKYPVGTRVPRNEEAERIVKNALYQSTGLIKTKNSM